MNQHTILKACLKFIYFSHLCLLIMNQHTILKACLKCTIIIKLLMPIIKATLLAQTWRAPHYWPTIRLLPSVNFGSTSAGRVVNSTIQIVLCAFLLLFLDFSFVERIDLFINNGLGMEAGISFLFCPFYDCIIPLWSN